MKNLHIIYACLMSSLIFAITSCKKFVDINGPKNQLTPSAVFADSTDASAAILGIYVNMMQANPFGFASGAITLYPGLSADELYVTTNDAETNQFYNNQILANNNINQSQWTLAYNYIYDANSCIEGTMASKNISTATINSLTGEAKFIRAFIYFNLVNLYGPVPIITTTDYHKNRLIARSPTDSVYSQIISDLKFAQANLPTSVSSGRANFYAATALLAKAYLYAGQYALAIAEADKVINSGKFSLETDLNNVFLATSKETIWNMLPVVANKATWEGYYFVPSSATTKPKYVITNTLFNTFEPGDNRKAKWIKSNISGGQSYPFPYKYKVGSTTTPPTEYSVVIRLGELYLIRSEAKANNNDITGSIADINLIRNRAGLPNTLASDKVSLLSAIGKERQVELFCEWGNRWFDLKRTNRAGVILSTIKSNWNNNVILYPIPLSELNANPNLKQNNGY